MHAYFYSGRVTLALLRRGSSICGTADAGGGGCTRGETTAAALEDRRVYSLMCVASGDCAKIDGRWGGHKMCWRGHCVANFAPLVGSVFFIQK